MVHYLRYYGVVHINKDSLTRRLLRVIFIILGGHEMRLQRRQFLKYTKPVPVRARAKRRLSVSQKSA